MESLVLGHSCHRFSLCKPHWAKLRGAHSSFPPLLTQGYFECQANQKHLYFCKDPSGKESPPRLDVITLFALPGLCQQCFCTWAWQTEQQEMPKQFWLLDSKGQNFSTANNGQNLTAITHKSSWTQNFMAYCSRKEASRCPPVLRVTQNLWNHKWRWTYRGPTKIPASSIPASMFHTSCLTQPYTVVEAVGRAQALPC